MTREELNKIFKETNSKWEGDNALKGINILAKYTGKVVRGAEHDIIYCGDIDECLEAGMTKEDAKELALLNWMVDEYDNGFSCFV